MCKMENYNCINGSSIHGLFWKHESVLACMFCICRKVGKVVCVWIQYWKSQIEKLKTAVVQSFLAHFHTILANLSTTNKKYVSNKKPAHKIGIMETPVTDSVGFPFFLPDNRPLAWCVRALRGWSICLIKSNRVEKWKLVTSAQSTVPVWRLRKHSNLSPWRHRCRHASTALSVNVTILMWLLYKQNIEEKKINHIIRSDICV